MLGMDTVRLLKTQDLGYLRTIRSIAAKEVKQREERLTLAIAMRRGGAHQRSDDDDDDDEEDADEEPLVDDQPRKIVFADTAEERDEAMKEQEHQDAEGDAESEDELSESDQKETPESLRRKLQNAKTRLKAIEDAEEELQLQRAKMAKTKTYGGITKDGKPVKVRERKR